MKIFLVVVICLHGLCENYVVTDPEFTSREECRRYSETVVEKIRKNFPDSAGSTHCFDEKELLETANDLLRQEREYYEQFNQSI